jgi:site-specific recombinase
LKYTFPPAGTAGNGVTVVEPIFIWLVSVVCLLAVVSELGVSFTLELLQAIASRQIDIESILRNI